MQAQQQQQQQQHQHNEDSDSDGAGEMGGMRAKFNQILSNYEAEPHS